MYIHRLHTIRIYIYTPYINTCVCIYIYFRLISATAATAILQYISTRHSKWQSYSQMVRLWICENLWVPFTDPQHFTYGIAGGTALSTSFSSFTTPKSTTNHQLQVCQASCMIYFLSTRKKWIVFSAPLYASKYHKQQINAILTNLFLLI